jgi:hypothetical protein
MTFLREILTKNQDDEEQSNCSAMGSAVESEGHVADKSERKHRIARSETRTVLGMKLLTLLVLIGATIAAALCVYFYVRNNETYQFEDEFGEYAGKVLESIGAVFETTFQSVDILAAGMVSHARSTGQVWPQVTIPDFGFRAAKVLPLSRSIILGILMLVYPETRLDWEAYSMEMGEAAYNQTLQVMENDPNYNGPTHFNWSLYQTIFGDFGDVPYHTT